MVDAPPQDADRTENLTPNQKRDFVGDNQRAIDKGLGMSILRLVHASYADATNVIIDRFGDGEQLFVNLGEIEDGMIDRIFSMVHTQKQRLSGERSE